MQANAVNSINFKSHYPEYELEREYDFSSPKHYDSVIDAVDEVQDTFVSSKDVKGPFPLFIAIGALFSKLGLKGAATALLIDQTTKNKASVAFDDFLKEGAKKAQAFGTQLVENNSKGLVKKVKSTMGEQLKNSAAEFGKVAAKNGATKNFGILGALATVIAFAPKAIMADNNKDGIKDIAQYSQVYDDSSAKLDKLQEKASVVGKLLALIT